MFGIEGLTERMLLINQEINAIPETFQVDDISVTVSNHRIDFIEWENEPNPDELVAAINQTFDNHQEKCAAQSQIRIMEAIEELPIPKMGKKAIIEQLFGE